LNTHRVQHAVKRAIDVAIASATLLACAPILGCVALLIGWNMGAPVLFRQQRPGRNGRPFLLYKFRTMIDACRPDGELLPDGDRLTQLGKFLRRTSLDELPQLWNVLRGDMSLVGPRPLLMKYLDRYSPEQARRLLVMPGITGWAQIHGRNAITWEEKLALDVWYVDHRSGWLDLRILGMTAWKILQREGISSTGHSTMPEFTGSEPARRDAA
jgi:sugar transferase EpsL